MSRRGRQLQLRASRSPVWVLQLVALVCVARTAAVAQDLTPRAYVITPIGSNAVVMAYSFSSGAVLADPTIPIEDSKGRISLAMLSYYHSFKVLGRSANITLSAPYAVGNYRALVAGAEAYAHRSGSADGRVRVAVNLRGGRAMRIDDFVSYRENVVIGTSVTVAVPSGQYDPARLINPGTNRWAIKPELGVSKRWNRWVVDGYGGVWFFAGNNAFYPGESMRTQKPIGAGEAHLAYYFKRALWMSFDGNFWAGGRSTINGNARHDSARNSRLGGTVSIPVTRHQNLKFSFSKGAYIAIGGDYTTISAGWQYHWISKPE